MFDSVWPHRWQPTRLPHPWDSPGKKLEWVAISFSSAWKWKVKVKSLRGVWLLATPWTAAYQAPPSMGFSRQEYWSGVPLLSPLHDCSNSWMLTAQTLSLYRHCRHLPELLALEWSWMFSTNNVYTFLFQLDQFSCTVNKSLTFLISEHFDYFYWFKNHLDSLPKVHKVCTTHSLCLTGLQI